MSASHSTSSARPSGLDQVIDALLSATEQLCATSQPSSFTVKNIAHESGVTTSLVYFYFQSKDDLIVATLKMIASDADALAANSDSAQDMAAEVSRFLKGRPAFARIIAWLILEGRSVTEEMGDHPFMRRLIATLATDQTEDPFTPTGVVVSLLLSNAFLSGPINVSLGRESNDHRIVAATDELIAALLSTQE